MATTRVVHVRKEPFDVYIGREWAEYPQSVWHNPFHIGPDGTREEVLVRYREWIMTQPHLLSALKELKGKTLGCWCHPLSCHGDILAELADQVID